MFRIGLLVAKDDMETIKQIETAVRAIPGNEKFEFDLVALSEGISVVGDTFTYWYLEDGFEGMNDEVHSDLDDMDGFKDIDPEKYLCYIVDESGEEYHNLNLGNLKCGKTFRVKLSLEIMDTFVK